MKRFAAIKDAIKKAEEKPLTDPPANTQDDSAPREPPPPPTPLEFPLNPANEVLGPLPLRAAEIYDLFLKIHRRGPTIEHLRSLAVRSSQELCLEKLVPQGFLPDASWTQDPATTGGSDIFPVPISSMKMLSNGMPAPGHEAYYRSAKELLYGNEDAFGAIQKRPSAGQPLVRVAIFRKFWDALLQMALYWDTSLDKYSDSESKQDVMDVDQDQRQSGVNSTDDNVKAKPTYTGRRIGTGRAMPPRFREETVFAFVEAVTLAFRCRVERHRVDAKVKLQNLLIPLQQTGAVYRSPKDRAQARRGFLEGPLIAIQCSNHTTFRYPGEVEGQGQIETANLLREIGLMLNLAQQRAREGEEKPDPSQGKWWVTKPRWGGGTGGDVGDSEGKNEEDEGSSKGKKRSKRSDAVESWKKLEPPSSSLDKGIVHLRIGKNKKSEFDDIYLISSVNHHISILHLRVHSKYLQFLNSKSLGKDFRPSYRPWYALRVERSKWFDLFVREERVQAMRAVWAVMAYLMREEE